MSVISGTAYWASITSPNTTFDADGTWSIDVGNLDADNKALAEKDGLAIKNKGDDRGDFVSIKRNVKRKDGNLNSAPEVLDAQKRTMMNTLVGNGSKVNVLYTTYEWKYKGRSGVSADLKKIQVVDLVPYQGDSDDAFDVVPDGYSADADEKIPFAS
jgi:hypothetical protein